MKQINGLLWLVLLTGFVLHLTSCVSSKKYKALESSRLDTELRIKKANAIIEDLKADTTFLGTAYRKGQATLKEQAQYADYTKGALVRKLKRQEKILAERDFAIIGKDKVLEGKVEELKTTRKTLDEKDRRLNNIKNYVIDHKIILDSMLKQFTGFLIERTTSGVNVYTRDGSLHITLPESTLFKPRSINVKPDGEPLLVQIANILRRYNDIEISVIGHTDNQPMKMGGIIKDNWDFGAIRAGAVLRILEVNGMSAWNITPVSKSAYYPIAENTTKEGQEQNRRIDIVVAPVWSKLFKMLEYQAF